MRVDVAAVREQDPFALAAPLSALSREDLGLMTGAEAEVVIAATQRLTRALSAIQTAAVTTFADRADEDLERYRRERREDFDERRAAVTDATAAYRPRAGLLKRIRRRDGTCRFPGCATPAERTQLDHVTPWPHGPTSADNLVCPLHESPRLQAARGLATVDDSRRCLLLDRTDRAEPHHPTPHRPFPQRLSGEPCEPPPPLTPWTT